MPPRVEEVETHTLIGWPVIPHTWRPTTEGDGPKQHARERRPSTTMTTAEETASARGVYRMRTGSKDVSRYQVRVWISKKHLVAGSAKAGKRVHLGCFKTLSTSTYVFDVVSVYFNGSTTQASARVRDSPILKFLLETIEDRSDLKEFRCVPSPSPALSLPPGREWKDRMSDETDT